MNCLVLLSVSERLRCEGRSPSEFPWAALARQRGPHCVPSSGPSSIYHSQYQGGSDPGQPGEAPESSRSSTGLAAVPRLWRVQFQSRTRTPTRRHKSPCHACPGFASPRPRREVIDSDPGRPYQGKGVRYSYLAISAASFSRRPDQLDQGYAESENLNGMTAKQRCLGHTSRSLSSNEHKKNGSHGQPIWRQPELNSGGGLRKPRTSVH